MEIKPIRSEEDYQAALEKLEHIFGTKRGTTEGESRNDEKAERFASHSDGGTGAGVLAWLILVQTSCSHI